MPFDPFIRSRQDLLDAVQQYGFLPLFAGSIPGFSIEERVDPALWYHEGSSEWKIWEWKGPVIRELGCAYGKFFEKKAAFISREWFADFANFRRDGYDFDARWDDGLAFRGDRDLYELLAPAAPILSKTLKKRGDYRKGGRSGFETVITRLQAQGYVLISDFVYERSRDGREYGWGIAEYSTPEAFFGPAWRESVYQKTPEESFRRILRHFQTLLPGAGEDKLRRFLKG